MNGTTFKPNSSMFSAANSAMKMGGRRRNNHSDPPECVTVKN